LSSSGGLFGVFLLPIYPDGCLPTYAKKNLNFPGNTFRRLWAGMRGSISLAAALAVPALPVFPASTRQTYWFCLFFSVITGTLLIQGLSLPWILNIIGLPVYDQREENQTKTC